MRTIILVISLLITTGCKSQINNNLNIENMKYFDIEKFERKKGKQNYEDEYLYHLPNKSKVREYKTSDEMGVFYIRDIKEDFRPLNYQYVYYDNGLLCSEIKSFNNSPLFYKEYDKLGKIIKEVDYDKNFKHSFEQIREIILRDKKIDIYDTKQAIVNRVNTKNNKNPAFIKIYYQVHIFNSKKSDGEWIIKPKENFLIDDETGEILTGKMIQEKLKQNQSSAPYRTHNGKTYTEEEWKIFEEQEYQKYLEKKNKKGFWDSLFG